MPILLKKPFSVGDLAPANSEGYKFVQIVNLVHGGLTMDVMLEVQVGTSSGAYYERWVRGENTPTKIINVPPSKVVELWSQQPQEGESIGEAMRRTTYQYILDEGYFEGEIVNNPPLPPTEAKPETPAETAPVAETPVPEKETSSTEEPSPADPADTDQPAEAAPAESAEQTEPEATDASAEEAPAEQTTAEGEQPEPVPSPS